MMGFIAMVAGGTLAVNQASQWFWTQQQASIAAQKSAEGQHYAYQHIGSPFLAALGLAVCLVGLVWFLRDYR
jgi:hypothetical protein